MDFFQVSVILDSKKKKAFSHPPSLWSQFSSPTGSSIHWVSSTDLDHLWIPFRKKSRHSISKTQIVRDLFLHTKPVGNSISMAEKCHNKSWFVEKCHSNVWGLLVVAGTKPCSFETPLVFPGLRCFGPYSASKTDPSNLAMPKGRLNSNHQGF